MYEVNTCLSIRLSFRVIRLENHRADLDEIWHGRYAAGVYPKAVHISFLQLVMPTWRTSELVRRDRS
jgi:hypothetical protein